MTWCSKSRPAASAPRGTETALMEKARKRTPLLSKPEGKAGRQQPPLPSSSSSSVSSSSRPKPSSSSRRPFSTPPWSPSSSSLLPSTPLVVARAALLLLFLVGRVVAEWKECLVRPEDHWVLADFEHLPLRMRHDYDRRYSCIAPKASFGAASYTFSSACTTKAFEMPDVHSCLKGRRMIIVGDSMATQQADSLVGMLGWSPSFLKYGDPRNGKWYLDKDGHKIPTLLDCWRQPVDSARRCERCFDAFESDHGGGEAPPSFTPKVLDSFKKKREKMMADRNPQRRRSQEDAHPTQEEADGGISVHHRMFSQPNGDNWLGRVVADFNETRPSDVFVVNFGAHYRDTPEDDYRFKRDTAYVLNDMAKLAETATVVWREIAPTHFPSVNGSFDSFEALPDEEKRGACCTGTSPPQSERNIWVEKYLEDNGMTDKVKVLRIYRMSSFRGSAHHTCHIGAPRAPEDDRVSFTFCPQVPGMTDCRHWSETGVVEEWNNMMLNHLCPP